MAKKKLFEENKLEIIPASDEQAALMAPSPFIVEQMPPKEKLTLLNLPALLKPATVPIGATVSGTVVKLIQNFTGDKDMRKSCVLQIHHQKTDRDFLFALTGTVRKACQQFLIVKNEGKEDETTALREGKDGLIGKTIFLTRREDGKAKRYGGNKMFNFDVAIMD